MYFAWTSGFRAHRNGLRNQITTVLFSITNLELLLDNNASDEEIESTLWFVVDNGLATDDRILRPR